MLFSAAKIEESADIIILLLAVPLADYFGRKNAFGHGAPPP